jgi:putative transcriptional regulator
MEQYRLRTGERLTYEILAERTGLSKATIESLASRKGYNATLDSIDLLCDVLECNLQDLLEHERISERKKRKNAI